MHAELYPQGHPHVLGLRTTAELLHVRNHTLIAMLDGDFDPHRILQSGVGEWLISGSGHATAFRVKRIREALTTVPVTGAEGD
jgi:hypothetical protein